MFMNIKTSSTLDISSSASISQQQGVNIHSPTEDDASHEAEDEVEVIFIRLTRRKRRFVFVYRKGQHNRKADETLVE